MNTWERLVAEGSCLYSVDDFEAAAYRLVTEQVLYYADARARNAYRVIEAYELNFKPVLELLGVELKVNRQLRYAVGVPQHPKLGAATQDETLFALVLRKIYDECVNRGEMTDDGEVHCDLVELSERFQAETKRALPERGRLDALIRAGKRWGIVRILDDEEDAPVVAVPEVAQPYVLVIRPAIADVLGETALLKLAVWRDPAPVPAGPAVEASESATDAREVEEAQ
jgi:hypothetical protein